jgi:deazaflavin-dependent oxidoreductase (nitroreductase family)
MKPGTIRLIGRLHAWLSKLTGGKLDKAPFMMLTTKGRKTRRLRTTPVLFFEDGPDLIVVASFGGNDMHPAWYLNLLDCSEAEILINGERRQVVARRVSPEERKVIWPRLIERYPNFAVYQQRTSREIPLLRLSDR